MRSQFGKITFFIVGGQWRSLQRGEPGVIDPHLRVTVVGDTYSVFVDGSATAATTLTTAQFSSGQVALYDFSAQTFDNFALVPEPSALGLVVLAGGAACWLRRRRQAPI